MDGWLAVLRSFDHNDNIQSFQYDGFKQRSVILGSVGISDLARLELATLYSEVDSANHSATMALVDFKSFIKICKVL